MNAADSTILSVLSTTATIVVFATAALCGIYAPLKEKTQDFWSWVLFDRADETVATISTTAYL